MRSWLQERCTMCESSKESQESSLTGGKIEFLSLQSKERHTIISLNGISIMLLSVREVF